MGEPIINIFFVISNITQLVAETYLAENTGSNPTIILYTKRFKPDMPDYKLHYFPYFDDKKEFELSGNNFLKKSAQKKELYTYISEICNNEKFVLFVPHLYINVLRMLVNHKDCTDYVYIEEGTLSYLPYEDIVVGMPENKFNMFQSKGLGFKVRSAYPDKEKKGVCLNVQCFPFLKNKNVLSQQALQTVLQIKSLKSNYSFDNQAILVFDSCVENRMAKLEEYLVCIIKSISYLKQQGKTKIFYKFHPDQHLYLLANFYRKYLDNKAFDIEFEELPRDLSLELVFLKSNNLTIIHTISSLGFYASVQGHQVYSNANYLLENADFKTTYFEPINKGFKFQLLSNS